MVEKFFGVQGLEMVWVWFRIEFQAQGTAHVHGCCRLKSDPGLMELAQQVLQSREARLQLKSSEVLSLGEDPFSEEEVSQDEIERTFDSIELSDEQVSDLRQQMQEVFKAQEIISEYNYNLIST